MIYNNIQPDKGENFLHYDVKGFNADLLYIFIGRVVLLPCSDDYLKGQIKTRNKGEDSNPSRVYNTPHRLYSTGLHCQVP